MMAFPHHVISDVTCRFSTGERDKHIHGGSRLGFRVWPCLPCFTQRACMVLICFDPFPKNQRWIERWHNWNPGILCDFDHLSPSPFWPLPIGEVYVGFIPPPLRVKSPMQIMVEKPTYMKPEMLGHFRIVTPTILYITITITISIYISYRWYRYENMGNVPDLNDGETPGHF